MNRQTGSAPASLRLPTRGGRGPRVAMLVFNDAHNDSRVLKEAATLRDAGATVRIFAVSRASAGFSEGREPVSSGVDIHRSQEFSLERVAPGVARMRSWLNGNSVEEGIEGQDASSDTAVGVVGALSAAPPGSGSGAGSADGRGGVPESGTVGQEEASLPSGAAGAPGTSSLLGRARRVLRETSSSVVALQADMGMRAYKTLALSTYWLRTARAALEWSPDVVHANDGNTLAPALWIVERCGARLVYDAHELWLDRNVRADRLLAPRVEAAIEARGVARADAVITVSPSIVRWMAEHYQMPSPPVLVRNVPVAGPAPDRSRGRLRELAGLGPDTQVIAYGGRITTSRGIEETIAALPALPESVHLVMLGYGEPDYLPTLWDLAARHGVTHRVHQVGPVAPHEVSEALSDADISVVHVRPTCLSYRYALPNKLFESIRGGVPVAAADLPDIRSVVERLGVGEVFSGEDPADLALTIRQILADPQRYRDAALAAGQHLTWQSESVALLGAYRRALLGPARARLDSSSSVGSRRARVLILSFSPIVSDARVLKQVRLLSATHEVTTCGYGQAPEGVAAHVQIPDELVSWRLDRASLVARRFSRVQARQEVVSWARKHLPVGAWDVVLANDAETVPLALSLRPLGGVHADLHEYAPRQKEGVLRWRLFVAPYVRWLCRRYVVRADSVTTVAQGLAQAYRREYGIRAGVVTNATPYHDTAVTPPSRPLRLVHSGAALPDRHLERMIEAVGRTRREVTFDLYLTRNDPDLIERLRQQAAQLPPGRVRVLDPVPYTRLVETLSGYDVGVFCLPPVSFNYKHALPNKLFDFVQARLAVVVSPSPEMAQVVRQHGLGVVTADFSSASLAAALDALTDQDVARAKRASDRVAHLLSAEQQVAGWVEAVAVLERRARAQDPSLVPPPGLAGPVEGVDR
ncbi:glycosyltransferase [Actinomyces wuliandei]|uniref:glycosyltransferase n=1 Tax=Actinomyces wuliandei TaxID=2057743 RepID=UPI00111A50B9|nr:glycosyltransferase [Actinomyces wuliandei]